MEWSLKAHTQKKSLIKKRIEEKVSIKFVRHKNACI